ncbi:transporter, partial [Plakobranchus ocellatus]
AFLVPYVICLVCIGIPMFSLETAFGQFGGKGPLSIWTINPALKGLGISLLMTSVIVFIYYNIIIAWGLNFLVASFTSHLPWIDCDRCACLLYNKNVTEADVDLLKVNNSLGIICRTIQKIGDVQWPLLLANFVAYAIIFLVLYKGIQSLGKVVYFTAIFPYILLTILLVRSAMLEGAEEGIKYYLTPRWERLKDAEVWSDAAVQIFFSLSACMGGLIAMSSYNKFDNNIMRCFPCTVCHMFGLHRDSYVLPGNCVRSIWRKGTSKHLDHQPSFKSLASPQKGNLRLSCPPSGRDAGGGARTPDRRVPADLRAGLGISLLMTSVIVFIYYNIIIAWGLNFLVASFTSHLPWIDCDRCACLLYNKNVTEADVDLLKVNNSLGIICHNDAVIITRSTEIFTILHSRFEVLHDSGTIQKIGDVQWPLLLANFVAYAIIFLVLYKGIQSLGKVVYFTAIFPYILLTILLVRSAMLEGAEEGIKYYLTPRWERLKDAEVWSDAAVQIFFSLSACMGGLIAMSSYNNINDEDEGEEENEREEVDEEEEVKVMVDVIKKDERREEEKEGKKEELVMVAEVKMVKEKRSGRRRRKKNRRKWRRIEGRGRKDGGGEVISPGLAFIVYPEALGVMPVSTLWAILFFFMLCILGFSTQFSAAETIMTSVIDEFPMFFRVSPARPLLYRISVCLAAFILGIPMVAQGGSYLLNLVDEAVLGFPMLFIGFFEYFAIIHLYGYNNFAEDIRIMLGRRPMFYFKATWTVIAPVCLVGVIVFKAYNGQEFEVPWAGLLYYLIVVFVLMWIPVYFFFYSCPRGLWQLTRAEKAWKDRRLLGKTPGTDAENGLEKGQVRYAYSTEGLQAHLGEYTVHIDARSNPQTEDALKPNLNRPHKVLMIEQTEDGFDNPSYSNNESPGSLNEKTVDAKF